MQNKQQPLPALSRMCQTGRLVATTLFTLMWLVIAPYDLVWLRGVTPLVVHWLLRWAVTALTLDGLMSLLDDAGERLKRLTHKKK